jgi:hypothetical protein
MRKKRAHSSLIASLDFVISQDRDHDMNNSQLLDEIDDALGGEDQEIDWEKIEVPQ